LQKAEKIESLKYQITFISILQKDETFKNSDEFIDNNRKYGKIGKIWEN
jgi:hypothetical protein